MPSDTFQGYALLRSVLKSGSDADVAKAVEYSKRIQVYPLADADDPPPTTFVDASDVLFDSTIQYDVRFFESLNEMVQAEPWLERDRAMIDPLKTIGIERGKPFNPDAATQQILSGAILEAKALFEAGWACCRPSTTVDAGSSLPRRAAPEHPELLAHPDSYPIDNRGLTYTFAFFSAKHIGEAQYYLLTINDATGQPLDGNASYRLRVPANVPVTQYWSVTVYNRATHTFILNADRVGRSSQTPGLQVNSDGSADIFFGRSAPSGQESNWFRPIQKDASRSWRASTVRRRRCSTSPGDWRISRKSAHELRTDRIVSALAAGAAARPGRAREDHRGVREACRPGRVLLDVAVGRCLQPSPGRRG